MVEHSEIGVMKSLSLTSYPEVNELLDLLHVNVKDILQDQFVGMYLFGSLANGDFDRHSDIDVLFVTKHAISGDLLSALQSMHKEIAAIDNWYSNQLEVSYIPKEALRRYDRNDNRHPFLDRGEGEQLHVRQHDSDWVVQRYILRERGITLAGPEPKSLIDPVSADDLRRAMQSILFDWYAHFLDKPNPFGSRGYQSYTVLSLCRILYTLYKGEVISKKAAAEWAYQTLDPCWTPLIERALTGRENSNFAPEPEDVQQTLAMIRYTLQAAKPTPYPEVNQLLNLLLSNVKEILGDQFVGMYLYGSLSSGDFSPETSDIDFLVVMNDALSDEKIAQLKSMHEQAWSTRLKRAGELEGAYVPRDLIRRHNPNGEPCPTVNEGRFYVAELGSDWIIQRHVIREYGVIVEGPDPKMLIDFVNPDEIRGAVRGVLEEWWFPMLEDPAWLKGHGGAYHSFAILTMCRALHALEHGTIVSKPAAARWAQKKLAEKWGSVIEQSLRAQKPGEAQIDLLDEALELIGYTQKTLKL